MMSAPGFPCVVSSPIYRGAKTDGFDIGLYLVFPLSCLCTYGIVKKSGVQHVFVRSFPCVMSFHLPQGE